MRYETVTPIHPKCGFCPSDALYDAKTVMGPWAYMCSTHFQEYGIRLGMGMGQRLKGNRT